MSQNCLDVKYNVKNKVLSVSGGFCKGLRRVWLLLLAGVAVPCVQATDRSVVWQQHYTGGSILQIHSSPQDGAAQVTYCAV